MAVTYTVCEQAKSGPDMEKLTVTLICIIVAAVSFISCFVNEDRKNYPQAKPKMVMTEYRSHPVAVPYVPAAVGVEVAGVPTTVVIVPAEPVPESKSAEAPKKTTEVALDVPLCCEKVARQVQTVLEGMEGVISPVICDLWEKKVIVRGADLKPEDILQIVRRYKHNSEIGAALGISNHKTSKKKKKLVRFL